MQKSQKHKHTQKVAEQPVAYLSSHGPEAVRHLKSLEGISVALFYEIAKLTGSTPSELIKTIEFGLSLKTIERYSKSRTKLEPIYSDYLLKIKSIYEYGQSVFGSNESFGNWMKKKSYGLGSIPLNLLKTNSGMDLLLDELRRIEYGDLS